jgi:hypothetical protein
MLILAAASRCAYLASLSGQESVVSAALFLQTTDKTPDKFQKYWEHARHALVERNQYGRRANNAGPIWLGVRLGTEKNASGYQAVVYQKGGYSCKCSAN